MRRRVLWVTLLALAAVRAAAAAGPVAATIETLDNNRFHLNFRVDVQASSGTVWGALTDYDHQAAYLPYLKKSHVEFRNWDYAIVDQRGQVHWMFWTFPVWVRQKVIEKPVSKMSFQAIDGDFSTLQGAWTLSGPENGPTTLVCDLLLQPRRYVPGWAVRWSARKYLGAMVQALAAHAEQRRP